MMRTITNPIIPGFYPDPSICRVKDDYYLVNSSFEMYPGIPIFHSKNLVDWEQIGNVMTKDNDFHVKADSMTGGVMAPTIRYLNGTFYVINANFSDKGNFIVKSTDPRKGWSKPYWLNDIPGIDASLFIDDDGSAYIVGTGQVVTHGAQKENGIYICKFDLDHMKMVGEYHPIWQSALRDAASPEGPHIYKVGDYYYLLIAEGGTEVNHAVTVARSKNLFDWFEGDPANPVLTSRNMGSEAKFTNIGHADLVNTPDGRWFAVFLGSRIIDRKYKNLGRETFMCPVEWENGWPYFSPATGQISEHYQIKTNVSSIDTLKKDTNVIFNEEPLPYELVTWGTPYGKVYSQTREGLILYCNKKSITQDLHWTLDNSINQKRETGVSFIGRRQTSLNCEVLASFDFKPNDNEGAGLVIFQAINHQYKLEKCLENGQQVVKLVLVTSEFNTLPHMPDFKAKTHEKTLVIK
jgi:xylan 1,4-beta-xylosidase